VLDRFRKLVRCLIRFPNEHKAVTVLLLLAAVLLAALYGPYKGFSDWFISTAMHTSNHRFLAEALYSDEYIDRVLDRNTVVGQHGASVPIPAAQRSESIELCELTEANYHGWLLTVDDPSRIKIVCAASDGELLEDIAERNGALAAINASGYVTKAHKGEPDGTTIYNGELCHSCEHAQHAFFGLSGNGLPVFGSLATDELLAQDYRDVVEFGPLLILNGEPSDISGNGGGFSARTAIGQTAEGKILLLVIDGMQLGSLGASMRDVQQIMLDHGAVNAMALDGGSSSSMYYAGEIINDPFQGEVGRYLPNAIIVV